MAPINDTILHYTSFATVISNAEEIIQARLNQQAEISCRGLSPGHKSFKMASPQPDYTSRTAEQEVCAVEICPSQPQYMVIGTYSLVKSDEPREYEAQTRKGSVGLWSVSPTFTPSYAGQLPPALDSISFPSAVLDLHFHPADPSLLGVATSAGSVHFFRFLTSGDVLGRRIVCRLLPLGGVVVAEDDEHGLTPLITQFTWFPELSTHGRLGESDHHSVSLACTTSRGSTIFARVKVPAIVSPDDGRLASPTASLQPGAQTIHAHSLEAWTVASAALRSTSLGVSRILLSGGDDSCLIASSLTTPPPSSAELLPQPALQLWKDRRNHSAGVVAILPLDRLLVRSSGTTDKQHEIIPVLTGSYDENLRVFEVDAKTYRAKMTAEFGLGGGVWRLKVLDQYCTTTATDGQVPVLLSETDETAGTQRHTVVLESLMHAGAAVARITYVHDATGETERWALEELARLRTPHESMVYCCDARVDREENDQRVYTIVSTSFYDKKICTWNWTDEFKAAAVKAARDAGRLV